MTSIIIAKFMPYILGALAGLAALVTAYLGIRKGGKDAERRKQAERKAGDLATKKEIDDEMARSSDDNVRDRLRKWNRK